MLASASRFATNVLIFNASPRAYGNTYKLLEQVKKGVESKGKTSELVQLSQLKFDGCIACLECKLKGKESKPGCVVQDDFTQYIDRIKDVDAFILGSPVYWSNLSSLYYKAYEKIMYSFHNYDNDKPYKMTRPIKTGLIFSGGAPKDYFDNGYKAMCKQQSDILKFIFKGHSEYMTMPSQLLLPDTSRLHIPSERIEEKKTFNAEHLEELKQNAFEMGVRLASE